MKKLFIALSLLCLSHLASAQSTDETASLRNSALDKEEKSNYLGAIADYTKAIAIEPDEINWYIWRADDFLEINDYTNAIKDMNAAISLEPDNVQLYVNRSLMKKQNGDRAGAQADDATVDSLRKKRIEELSTDLASDEYDLDLNKSMLSERADLFVLMDQFEKAIADWLTLSELAPEDSVEWYFKIGDVYKEFLKSDEKAVHYYTLAIKSPAEPNNFSKAIAHIERGTIRVAQGDIKAGCADYRTGQRVMQKEWTDMLYRDLPECAKNK